MEECFYILHGQKHSSPGKKSDQEGLSKFVKLYFIKAKACLSITHFFVIQKGEKKNEILRMRLRLHCY